MSADKTKNSVVSDDGFKQLSLHGSPKVLIVDDEELMREITKLIVEENGGTAIEAADGAEGVEIFKKHFNDIDCVFLDFSMPKMNGYEALLEMRKIKPQICVVMASGLRAINEVKELAVSGEIEFVSKPFHEVELIKSINRACESAKR